MLSGLVNKIRLWEVTMMMYWGNGWFHGFGFLMMILFWIVIFLAIVFFVKVFSAGGKKESAGSRESALDILQKRYAKGEITREEFNQMKEDIK